MNELLASGLRSLSLYWALAAWPILGAVIGAIGWTIAFTLPLGRRRVSATRKIAAPREEVWRKIDPREPDRQNWSVKFTYRNRQIIGESPLTVAFERQPKDRPTAPFERVVAKYESYVAGKAYSESYVSIGATEIAHGDRATEWQELRDIGAGSTLAKVTVEFEARGLLSMSLMKRGVKFWLRHLDDAARSQPAARAPLVQLSSPTLAVSSILCALYFFGGFQSSSRSPISPVAIPLMFLGAILLHEVGHALALLAFGHRPVTLAFLPFGGAAMGSRPYADAFEAGVVALSGVGFSILMAIVLIPWVAPIRELFPFVVSQDRATSVGAAKLFRESADLHHSLYAWGALMMLIGINIFNLMPFGSSDGACLLDIVLPGRWARWTLGAAIFAFLASMLGPVAPAIAVVGCVVPAIFSSRRPKAPAPAPTSRGGLATLRSATALTVGLYFYLGIWVSAPFVEAFSHVRLYTPEGVRTKVVRSSGVVF